MVTLRSKLHAQLDPLAWSGNGLSPLNRIIISVVLLSILAAVIESEPSIESVAPNFFFGLNLICAIAFSLEYIVRVWAMGENEDYSGFGGRVRFAFTYAAMVDLVVTVALWIDVFFGFPGFYGVLFRLVRVLRILTLARKSRWATATRLMISATKQRSTELSLSIGFALVVLVASATVLFIAEGQIQPDAFGSIPRAMWWAIATLTTVGYGDVYPVTSLGKFFASIVALSSIAIVAMPTGIMAAAFSDAFQELREEDPAAIRKQ